MSYSRIHTTTQRSLPANHLSSTQQIPAIQNSPARTSATTLTQRSAIPTRSSRSINAQSFAESTLSSPSEDTVRRGNHAGQSLATFMGLGEAGVPDGIFMNTTGPIHFHNERVSSRQPLDNHENVAMGNNGTIHGPSENSEYDIYCKYLLVQKRGIPLWEPGPQLMFPTEYRKNGISIGDVGVLNSTTGEFAFLFNIFLPADHEINDGRVPNGFIPLDKFKATKNMKKKFAYDRGSCLASSSLRRTESSKFAFQTTGREGAILVMPDGALSEDLRNYKLVQDYIVANLKRWYEFVESDDCGMPVENGEIQVVIGTDKVSSWGMATFENVNVEDPLLFEFKEDESASQPPYKWHRIIAGRAGPPEEEIRDLLQGPNPSPLRNQCVFVRTLNAFVPRDSRNELAVQEVRANGLRHCISDSSRHQAQPGQRNSNVQISQPVSHPLKLINRCLLKMCPDAEIIITKDLDWISVITENDTTPSFEDICARVLASHIICDKQGVVTLKKRPNIFTTGSIPRPSAITIIHHQITSESVLPMGNEKGTYVIGRLFLETPDHHTENPITNGEWTFVLAKLVALLQWILGWIKCITPLGGISNGQPDKFFALEEPFTSKDGEPSWEPARKTFVVPSHASQSVPQDLDGNRPELAEDSQRLEAANDRNTRHLSQAPATNPHSPAIAAKQDQNMRDLRFGFVRNSTTLATVSSNTLDWFYGHIFSNARPCASPTIASYQRQPSRFRPGVPVFHSKELYTFDGHYSRCLHSDSMSYDRALNVLYSPSFTRDLPPNTTHYSRTRQHNALISLALALSDDRRFRDLKARQYFMKAECQKPTLAVVQALSSLGTFYGSQGEQGLRYMYFGLSARVVQALGLAPDFLDHVDRGLMNHSDTVDRKWTTWCRVSTSCRSLTNANGLELRHVKEIMKNQHVCIEVSAPGWIIFTAIYLIRLMGKITGTSVNARLLP